MQDIPNKFKEITKNNISFASKDFVSLHNLDLFWSLEAYFTSCFPQTSEMFEVDTDLHCVRGKQLPQLLVDWSLHFSIPVVWYINCFEYLTKKS